MPALPSELLVRRARDADLPEMARLHYASFPGAALTLEERISYLRNDPRLSLEDHWVCERKGRLVGLFALYNFKLQRFRIALPAGGIGMVAVAPEARRQKIAYWMMLRAVQIMEQNEQSVSILYPFNHSFYRSLGWGCVGRTTLYRLPPGALPNYPERRNVTPVTTWEDQSAVMECYERFSQSVNGLLVRDEPIWLERVFKNNICYAYRSDKGAVEGYLTFAYQPLPPEEHFTGVNLVVKEMAYITDEALRGLLGFLAAQSDQARAVILPDQTGVQLEHALSNPIMEGGRHNWALGAETAWVGTGQMGRIVNLRRALGMGRMAGGSGRVTFHLHDDLNPANAEPLTVEFEGGRPDFPKLGPTGLSFRADIAVFASLYWGALSILEARRFGLIELEGEGDRALLNRLFHLPKPICYDQF